MRDFKKLNVWREGIELIKLIYKMTAKFPRDEMYALSSQVKRASVSIPSNIAEGAGRRTNKDFLNFLSMATGSCFELETQIIIARELGFITQEQFAEVTDKIDHIEKMIFKLEQSINS